MRAYRVLLLPFLALMCMGADDSGCQSESSSDVNQNRIYASYWVLYDAQSDITFARAQFRFGSEIGTTLELTDGATVEFNGKPLGFNGLLDWHEVELAGQVDNGVFVYTDVDGNVFENPMPTMDIATIPATFPQTLPVSSAFELAWEGTPLVEGELMEVIVALDSNRFDFARFDQRTPGSTSVVLGADQLAKVGLGPAVIGLRRHHDHPLVNGAEAGGKLTTTYQSPDFSFELQ